MGDGGASGPQPPNVALLPRMDLAQHLLFPRPVPPTSAISDQNIAGIDKSVLGQVAAALQRTDMGFLWVSRLNGMRF